MAVSGLNLVASVATGVLAGLLIYSIAPPRRSLQSRVNPYLRPSSGDVRSPIRGGVVSRTYMPMILQIAERVGRLVEHSGGEATLLRIRQAGWFAGTSEENLVSTYRIAQLKALLVGTSGGFAIGWILGLPVGAVIALGVLGLVVGATRQRGRLQKAIERRREVMRIEIYTVNQLLAMRVRAGGGVVHAVGATVERGQGAVIDELAQALRLHRAGWRSSDAFRRIAELTPEPFCSRTYRLLASAEERGSDLAIALLALSEDVRETRREAIKRSATKRRAAMLVPTIAILAPVLILFVAAPLPYLITGWQ